MMSGDVTGAAVDIDDSGTARITLRLPESLKQRVEERSARQSISVNSWLVRAIAAAVDTPGDPTSVDRTSPTVNSRFTGWVS